MTARTEEKKREQEEMLEENKLKIAEARIEQAIRRYRLKIGALVETESAKKTRL